MSLDIGVLRAQIGAGNLMAVGARDWVRDGANRVMFRVGPSRKLAKLIVELTPMDEYTVRYVEMSRTTYEVVVDETVEAFCDNVGAVVRRMGDRS